jgi:hypothetical protein
MSKKKSTYKLWISIERIDETHNDETYTDLTDMGVAEPVPIAVFETFEAAQAYAESLAIDKPKKKTDSGGFVV